MRVLHLTSPHMNGADVLQLQKALHSNKYGNFYKDKLDSEYGPQTAQAVHRAKFWLGYSSGNINQSAGPVILALLLGTKPLPPLNALRRRRRVAVANRPVPLRLKALKEMKSHLGVTGVPNIFTRWYGIVGAWCAMSASFCYYKVGSKVFKAGRYYAYVPYILADARAGRNHLTITHHPEPGDLVIYCWDNSGNAEHVGLFDHWISSTEFEACEGNASDAVRMEKRYMSNVVAFVHVGA